MSAPDAGQITGGSCGPRNALPVVPEAGVRPVAPTTAAQSWDVALVTGGVPFSSKISWLPLNVAVSGRLNCSWLGVVKPHGYALMSSEWASTLSWNWAELDAVSVSPNSTACRPSGAKSVRVICTPLVVGSAI